MDLVVHHVLESLVVGGAEEDLCVELAASEAVVEHLVPSQVVTVLPQQLGDLLHIDSIVEGRGVSDFSLVGRDLATEATTTTTKVRR